MNHNLQSIKYFPLFSSRGIRIQRGITEKKEKAAGSGTWYQEDSRQFVGAMLNDNQTVWAIGIVTRKVW